MFLDDPNISRCSLWSSATSISDGIFSTIRGKGGQRPFVKKNAPLAGVGFPYYENIDDDKCSHYAHW